MALLTIAENEKALVDLGVDRFAAIAQDAVRERGQAIVCLTGGSTPQAMYEALARERSAVPWANVHVFWGDERAVPPQHKDSNYGMARDALLAHVPIPPAHVHRMRGELPPEQAAVEYEHELMGTFDLMLLGVGEDAHIASIFPGSPVLGERVRRTVAVYAPHLETYRITLTPPALLDARRILTLVAGTTKANAVMVAIEAPDDPARWPVHLLRRAANRVEWLIDRAAARALSSPRG